MRLREEELQKALLNQDSRSKAFEQVVNDYSPQIYSLIRKMVLNHDDADDIIQEVYIKAWTSLDSFRGDSKISTWLYRISYNECLQFLQKKKKIISLDSEECSIVNQLMSDDYFDGDETEAQLQEAIQSLPEKQRFVFNLKYYQELKYEEISEICGTTIGALKTSYHFAVKKIEDFFNSHD
ncbi:MAG: sigma-70 family RNA polymerase sigma factor [Bacteroidaceae bacterium]|nr:sigma-70 family RNA polymerase sigma factor [Bacteroidaceae bacterium]